MSKPALGRGLGGLLSPPPRDVPSPLAEGADGPPTGVQLLLRGENGQPIAPPPPTLQPAATTDATHLPSWALGSLLLADILLVLVAGWIAFGSHAPGRLLVTSLLILLGGALLSLGVWLRGERGAAELQTLNPFDEERPRVRVQFLDQKR